MRHILIAVLSGLLLFAGCVQAQPTKSQPGSGPTLGSTQSDSLQDDPLEVAIKVAPPFVIANDDGSYGGLAVELWEEAAAEHGWKFHYRRYDLDGLLDAVAQGKADVGIGAITVTSRREQRMDFSHPITSSGLGVAVRQNEHAGWLEVARSFFSLKFLKVTLGLAALLLVVGVLTWLFERKRNADHFGGKPAHGIGAGFWWAAVTMTTVGYGDKTPVTLGGRIIGIVWMFAALIVASTFTATISSALTVGQLSARIQTAGDLSGLKVATLGGTTSERWLHGKNIHPMIRPNLDTALSGLAGGKYDAVVYDDALLRWTIHQDSQSRLAVLPFTLERQDYAYALPTDSLLREPLNASLLERINAPDWRDRVSGFLGNDD